MSHGRERKRKGPGRRKGLRECSSRGTVYVVVTRFVDWKNDRKAAIWQNILVICFVPLFFSIFLYGKAREREKGAARVSRRFDSMADG